MAMVSGEGLANIVSFHLNVCAVLQQIIKNVKKVRMLSR